MKKEIAILKGDGIGPEVMSQAIKVIKAIGSSFGHEFILKEALIGAIAIDKTNHALPDETLQICKSADAILLGAIGDPKYDNAPNALIRPEQGLLALRKALGLFSNIRPVQIYKQLIHLSPLKEERLKNVDFVICRELTGGIYFGEKVKTENYSSDLCIYHEHEIERIAHRAFELAQKRSKKLCLVDKANVLESSRLWRSVIKKMSKNYEDVSLDFLYVDNAAMQLILNPGQFDVILTSNMFGDILSDEASVLNGSVGILPSASYGEKYSLYEPVHGSYPQAKGKDIANPLATIMSVEIMFKDFNMINEAKCISDIIAFCLDNNFLTEDLNPLNPIKCSQVGDIFAEEIYKRQRAYSN